MFTFTSKQDNGFTLVETLVAVGILATAIVAPMVIAQTGIQTARQARDGVTAQFLASEAVELLRNTRDDNIIAGGDWDSGLRVGTGPFRIDAVAELESGNGIESCSGSCDNDYLYFDEDTSLYSYDSGGEQTIFVRTVEVTQIHSDEIRIDVTVTWDRPGRTFEFVLTEHLFEW